jgi:hypothetical protein
VVNKLKELALRRSVGAPAFGLALGLSIWATVERGLFDGVTLLIAASGLLLGLLQLLPTRPKLRVSNREGHAVLTARPEKLLRPLEEDEIVEEQAATCREEMPRMPAPDVPPGSPAAALFQTSQAAANLMAATSGVSDESLRKYLRKVSDYAARLRDWLSKLEDARSDQARLFDGELRIREMGQAAADHVHLRLHFPDGFALDDEPPEVGRPPKRPRYPRLGYVGSYFDRADYEMVAALRRSIRLPGSDKPQYSIEGGRVKADWDLGRLNQSDHRDVPAFRLKAAAPGIYEVQWEATAAGLSRPSRGSLTINVEEPEPGEPVSSLADAEAEREDYELP